MSLVSQISALATRVGQEIKAIYQALAGKEPAITKATGYLRHNGTAWEFKNETYLTGVTKPMVESVLTGEIASHAHSSVNINEPSYVSNSITKTARPLFDVLRGDRTAFLPETQIIIESSTDAGVTWVDAGISDSNKRRLFTGQRPTIGIPLKAGIRSCDCMLRITITGMKYNVPDGTPETDRYGFWNASYVQSNERYFAVQEGWAFVNSVDDKIYLKVERATGLTPTAWVNVREAFLSGWTGGNYFSLYSNFGGGITQTSNSWNWRFTFRTCSLSHTFNDADLSSISKSLSQAIHHIKISGKDVWTFPNRYMYNDHLYSWDEFQNAVFPKEITGSRIISTVPTGSAPFSVSSATVVPNLNSDLLDGKHASEFALSGHEHAYLTGITKAMVEAQLTGNISSHTHNYQAYSYDLSLIAALTGTSGILKKVAAGNWQLDTTGYEPKLSNGDGSYSLLIIKNGNRYVYPITDVADLWNLVGDGKVTQSKLGEDLTSRQTVAASEIDWSTGAVFTKVMTANTTFTFSGLQQNKVITLILSGNYTVAFPAYCKRISGTYDGSTVNYIQFHCTNNASGSEEVWFTISKQAT